MKPFVRDWKEAWIDRMGLIVALGGEQRFEELRKMKNDMKTLPYMQKVELQEAIRMRFAPTNGMNGCVSGTEAVREVRQ